MLTIHYGIKFNKYFTTARYINTYTRIKEMH
jgi:hypothetical protein